MKNDSGVKSATGLTGSGIRDWIVQRFGAVVLALYSLTLLGFFLLHGEVSYFDWVSFMTSLPMKLFSVLAIVALAGHAWVGLWTVFTDYITTSKIGGAAPAIRLALQALMIAAILIYVFWGITIFWGFEPAIDVVNTE